MTHMEHVGLKPCSTVIEPETPIWGFPKTRVPFWGGPYNKEIRILLFRVPY